MVVATVGKALPRKGTALSSHIHPAEKPTEISSLLPMIMQGAAPVMSHVISASAMSLVQHSALVSPPALEHPVPPHCPQAATQQMFLFWMPGRPLLHISSDSAFAIPTHIPSRQQGGNSKKSNKLLAQALLPCVHVAWPRRGLNNKALEDNTPLSSSLGHMIPVVVRSGFNLSQGLMTRAWSAMMNLYTGGDCRNVFSPNVSDNPTRTRNRTAGAV